MKAVILAAGKGKRMKHLTAFGPKPMLELCGKPMLEHILIALRDAGIREFIIVTGHFAEMVEGYFQNGARLGVRVHYIRQEVQSGTGAALHRAKDLVDQEAFFAGYGDVITSLNNYPRFIQNFQQQPCDALLSLNWVEDPYRGAAVYLEDNDLIADIIEKPLQGTSKSHWNNAGLLFFSPLIFEYSANLKPSARGEYEITDAIKAMIVDKRQVRGFKLEGFWSDVGRPEDIETVRQALCGHRNPWDSPEKRIRSRQSHSS